MKPTVTILIGAPVSGDEARFLQKLTADLTPTGALILANFVVDERQIDFVVVTPTYAALLELKNFPRPIFGDRNGVWKYLDAAGSRVRYPGMNPWQQTLKQKYALSDAMKEYQRRTPDLPGPSGASFYGEFAAFVCVYPAIHPSSRVTTGDHKVEVRSYADIVDLIRSGGKASTWMSANWQRFAEEHLNLSRVSLEEATDCRVQDAHIVMDAYRERIRTILGTGLPPVIDSIDELCGSKLVVQLLQPQNFLIVGPSGSAKTFHLHHVAIACAAGESEVPLLIEGVKYRGGEFWSLLRHGVAPFCREDPKELLDAIRLCGQKPVLLVDALNECAGSYVIDLLKGVQAFALRFDARIVVTSQQHFELAAELKAVALSLQLPDDNQKRIIYAHHARVPASPELDRFCAGFTNAYDLTVAGRCHSAGAPPQSRVTLYDRYVRQCLPDHTALLTALLRTIASALSEAIALAMARDRFERIAEDFLSREGATLDLIDVLAESRLVRLSGDSFTFEHELLAKYFRAEALRRATTDATLLAAELRRPINHDLVEFVVPRFTDSADLAALLASTNDVGFLAEVCAGNYGVSAQRVLLEEATQLLDAAIADVPSVAARCVSADADGGRRRLVDVEVTGARAWTSRDALLCEVVARNLDQPPLRGRFLNLLDVTEWTLRAAVHKAAKAARFNAQAVWGDVVRLYGGVLIHGTLKIPCTAVLCGLRNYLMRWHEHNGGIPIREQLLERVNRNPESDFSLLALLQDRDAAAASQHVAANIELVRRAWASDIYILQIDALEFVEYMSRAVHETCPENADRIREMLEGFETDDIMINTARLEALNSYGGLKLGMTADDACAEMRALIANRAATDPHLIEIAKMCSVTPFEWVSSQAYSCLTKIFEDLFQGVYCEAYYELAEDERAEILCLAAQAPDVGYLSDWLLQELVKVADERALPVYRRFASRVTLGTTAMAQEAVTAFELGLAGCARWSEAPPAYEGGDSTADQAWRVIGEILFWLHRSRSTTAVPDIAGLWAQLDGDALIAASDVLYHLANIDWRARESALEGPNLVRRFPHEIRRIMLACLSHTGPVPSIFSYGGVPYGGLTGFVLHVLGTVGNETDIPILRQFVEDFQLGKTALGAIEQINRLRLERSSA